MKLSHLFKKEVTYEHIPVDRIREIDVAFGEFGKHHVTYIKENGNEETIEAHVRYKSGLTEASFSLYKENGEAQFGELDLPIKNIL